MIEAHCAISTFRVSFVQSVAAGKGADAEVSPGTGLVWQYKIRFVLLSLFAESYLFRFMYIL
ncbi:MAG: hypothetical protein IJ460_03185 [Clostridia bacterium]|nr:hypothetical protein [Clostridia bacterium]